MDSKKNYSTISFMILYLCNHFSTPLDLKAPVFQCYQVKSPNDLCFNTDVRRPDVGFWAIVWELMDFSIIQSERRILRNLSLERLMLLGLYIESYQTSPEISYAVIFQWISIHRLSPFFGGDPLLATDPQDPPPAVPDVADVPDVPDDATVELLSFDEDPSPRRLDETTGGSCAVWGPL